MKESCDYGEFTSEMIRYKLVVRILDTALSQQLQLDSGLTIEIAKKRICQREAVGEQHKELNGGKDEPVNIQELQHPDQWKRKGTSKGVPNAKIYNRRVTNREWRDQDGQHSSNLCETVPPSTSQYYPVQLSTPHYYTVLHATTLYYTPLHRTPQDYTILSSICTL